MWRAQVAPTARCAPGKKPASETPRRRHPGAPGGSRPGVPSLSGPAVPPRWLRLTIRSRADPPRQVALPGKAAAAILAFPGKAPYLCGPLSSNVRRRLFVPAMAIQAPDAASDLAAQLALGAQLTCPGRLRAGAPAIVVRSDRGRRSLFANQVARARHALPPPSGFARRLAPWVSGLSGQAVPPRWLRLTIRSRADPPRQVALPGKAAAAILAFPGKAPYLCGPLSSNVRRRLFVPPVAIQAPDTASDLDAHLTSTRS